MSLDRAHRLLIAYDVSDDQRRNRLAKYLESHGDRVQYSVFLVDSRPARVVRIKTGVQGLLDLESDSVLFCDLGPLSGGGLRRIAFVGRRRPITGAGPIVL